jgi:hypothetical protein
MQPERFTEEKTPMKVGVITLMTAFLLVLPLAAFAGPPPLDEDGDTIPDASDNCPTVPNAGQLDVDTDGSGDVCDNCLTIENGPTAYRGGLAAVSQYDSDLDGYGNACDGDTNQDGFCNAQDNTWFLACQTNFAQGPSGYACAGTPPCP